MTTDYETWRRRLIDTFADGTLLAPQLVDVLRAEADYQTAIRRTCEAHEILADSFQSFWIDTIRLSLRMYGLRPANASVEYYAPTLLDHIAAFRSVRGAEVLFYNGYPMDGFGLVRDITESALLMAAIAHGYTTYKRVNGLTALGQVRDGNTGAGNVADDRKRRHASLDKVRAARIKEQKQVLSRMIGARSGLKPDTIELLRASVDMFHTEVHGSRLTALESKEWIQQGSAMSFGPVPEKWSVAGYVNRSEEACWMWLRLLPCLQLAAGGFGAEWARRWKVLDESFRYQVEGLCDLGKPIGKAILELTDEKFPFDMGNVYIE